MILFFRAMAARHTLDVVGRLDYPLKVAGLIEVHCPIFLHRKKQHAGAYNRCHFQVAPAQRALHGLLLSRDNLYGRIVVRWVNVWVFKKQKHGVVSVDGWQ